MGFYGWKSGTGRTATFKVDSSSGAVPNEGDALKFVTAGYVGTITGASPGQIVGIAAQSIYSIGSSDGDYEIEVYIDDDDVFEYLVETASNLAPASMRARVDMEAVQTIDENAASNASNQVRIIGYDSSAGTARCQILFSLSDTNKT